MYLLFGEQGISQEKTIATLIRGNRPLRSQAVRTGGNFRRHQEGQLDGGIGNCVVKIIAWGGIGHIKGEGKLRVAGRNGGIRGEPTVHLYSFVAIKTFAQRYIASGMRQ